MAAWQEKVRWLVDRFRVMPPAEIPHRVREQYLRRLRFQPPPVPPRPASLPCLPLAIPRLTTAERVALTADVHALLSEDFALLGHRWTSRRDWGHDPGAGVRWPLSGPPHDIPLVQGDADVRVGWELLRLQHLQVLALGAAVLDRDDARQAVYRDLQDYLSQPACEGVDYASGIECGLRAVSVLAVSALVPVPPEVWDMLHHHAVWLRRFPSLYSSANNHRIAELAGLYLIGLCAPGIDVGGLDSGLLDPFLAPKE